jgi:hypothetical protein
MVLRVRGRSPNVLCCALLFQAHLCSAQNFSSVAQGITGYVGGGSFQEFWDLAMRTICGLGINSVKRGGHHIGLSCGRQVCSQVDSEHEREGHALWSLFMTRSCGLSGTLAV